MAVTWLTKTDLPPDVFAVVMATGVVSIAARDHAYSRISIGLAVLAVLAFVVLALGLVLRVIARPRSALGALSDPDVALSLFASVAACAVLGARFDNHWPIVWALGAVALAAWLLLAPLSVRDVRSRPRSELRDHAHGAWLLPSVATSGLAITAADLSAHSGVSALLVIACTAWLLGLAIYVAVSWLILWRALSPPFSPDQVTPDSWILMGALAIATLAGNHLLAAADAFGARGYQDWIRPMTLGSWVVAGLWIPALLYAELWRADHRVGSLHYTRIWWAAVFPLGMYSSATQATSTELHMRSLTTISLVFFWVAFTVWLLVTVGLVHLRWARSRLAMR